MAVAVAAVAEDILVTATDAPTLSETTTAQSTYTSSEVDRLAIGRDILATTLLAPGTSATGPLTPNGNTATISGAMSFENLWMVNGVVINENLRGQPLDLFIEDAIEGDHGQHSGDPRRVRPFHRRRGQRAHQVGR